MALPLYLKFGHPKFPLIPQQVLASSLSMYQALLPTALILMPVKLYNHSNTTGLLPTAQNSQVMLAMQMQDKTGDEFSTGFKPLKDLKLILGVIIALLELFYLTEGHFPLFLLKTT